MNNKFKVGDILRWSKTYKSKLWRGHFVKIVEISNNDNRIRVMAVTAPGKFNFRKNAISGFLNENDFIFACPEYLRNNKTFETILK